MEIIMKDSDYNYTWTDVEDAANKLLVFIVNNCEVDIVKVVYDNNLPSAMKDIAKFSFVYGNDEFLDAGLRRELELIRMAYKQIDKVGYVGN